MGWFSGWFGDNNTPSTTNNDPLRNLDPSLREFLEKESPIKYDTSPPPRPSPPSQPALSNPPTTSPNSEPANKRPAVPPESLFQDGRYAHLWSTYKPLTEVENIFKSDQEKLMDLLEGYKSRKARIGKAALENCVEEQEAMSDCYRHGGWKDQMTMCRKQNKAFERCYTMQARFLKALGYLSAYDRPADIDEQIQMHADTLYHQMLDHEAAVAKAKASDTPVPEFPPLISPSSTLRSSDHTTQQQQQQQQPPTTATGQPISSSAAATLDGARSLSYEESTAQYLQRLKPSVREGLQAEWEKKKLSKEEKMLAARAYAMEAEAGIGVANQVGKLMEETRQRREERRKEGTATLGDWVSGLLGR